MKVTSFWVVLTYVLPPGGLDVCLAAFTHIVQGNAARQRAGSHDEVVLLASREGSRQRYRPGSTSRGGQRTIGDGIGQPACQCVAFLVGGQGNFRHTLCVHGELGQGAEVPERQIFAAVRRLCPRGVQPIGKAACHGCLRGRQGEGDGSVVEGQRPVVPGWRCCR